jgi:polar amino acid transport system substrate-binding protein
MTGVEQGGLLRGLTRLAGVLLRGWLLSMMAGTAWAAVGDADEPLTLHYQQRPPYSGLGANGAVQGLLVAPVENALRKAGLAFRWVQTPSNRQLALIQEGAGADCGLGWFRSTEREALGRFSAPIYRDKAWAALARPAAALTEALSLREALASADVRVLTKEGYSYGTLVDAMLGAKGVRRVSTTAEASQMVPMLLAGRADWMLVAPEEADQLLALARVPAASLRLVTLRDLPAGAERHLYCNHAVPDAVLRRVNPYLLSRSGNVPVLRAGGLPR